MDRLGCTIDQLSNLIVVTANGARTKSLGVTGYVPISIGKLNILTFFQVLESKDEILILGNGWLRRNQAVMNWKQLTLTIHNENRMSRIPVTFTKTWKVEV